MIDLYIIATTFRAAIEEAVRAGNIKEMKGFPIGCCTYASDLLQRYLIEQYEFFTWFMSGKCGNGEDGESHAWLETQDHSIVIDITGDQYRCKKLRFEEPVYVGPRNDCFHDKFILDVPVAYFRDEDEFGGNRDLDRRYETVKSYIRWI